jgi:hypothetical protein
VQRFAGQPGVTRQRPGPKPAKPVQVAVTVDGCDRNYGRRVQCIPVAFPGDARDKCAWLRAHAYQTVPVVGKDRQHLDADRNGIACDG